MNICFVWKFLFETLRIASSRHPSRSEDPVQQVLIAVLPAVVTALGGVTVAWLTQCGDKERRK